MKIAAELYGKQFGDDNITIAFKDKLFSIRLDFYDDLHKHSFIVNAETAKTLIDKLSKCFKDATEYGFQVK